MGGIKVGDIVSLKESWSTYGLVDVARNKSHLIAHGELFVIIEISAPDLWYTKGASAFFLGANGIRYAGYLQPFELAIVE